MGWLAVTTGVSAELVIASNYAPPDQFEFHALTSILGPLYLSLKKMKKLVTPATGFTYDSNIESDARVIIFLGGSVISGLAYYLAPGLILALWCCWSA